MLYEKYRPRDWDDVVGQDKVVKALRRLAESAEFDRGAIWIEGASGQGKTTLARLFGAAKGATALTTTEIDARGLTLERVRDIQASTYTRSIFGRASVFIVNEAQTMSRAAAQYLLTALESLNRGVYWVFTSTTSIAGAGEQLTFCGLDAGQSNALRSRMLLFKLNTQGLGRLFAERARDIAIREGLDGQPLERYVRAVKESRNNLRAVLQAVEAGDFLE